MHKQGVLTQRESVYDRCELEMVKDMEDKFINIQGKYFYSLNDSITLEIFCVESLKNAQVTIKKHKKYADNITMKVFYLRLSFQ